MMIVTCDALAEPREAVRIADASDLFDIVRWVVTGGGQADVAWTGIDEAGNPVGLRVMITTDQGVLVAGMGDWIVKGMDGKFFPLTDERFHATHAF